MKNMPRDTTCQEKIRVEIPTTASLITLGHHIWALDVISDKTMMFVLCRVLSPYLHCCLVVLCKHAAQKMDENISQLQLKFLNFYKCFKANQFDLKPRQLDKPSQDMTSADYAIINHCIKFNSLSINGHGTITILQQHKAIYMPTTGSISTTGWVIGRAC